MTAPIALAHSHVHSMRISSGAEALVARVITTGGTAGFGFTLNFEAIVAREMAAWDALARERDVPFHALFGKRTRERVEITAGERNLIDPFEGAPLEEIRRRAGALERLGLIAPNGHPWETGYCAALAATLPGEICITMRTASSAQFVPVPAVPGLGIEWSIEPGFACLRWMPT